jgi:hypothetical protein
VGFEATTPKAPQKLKRLAKPYLFIKDQDDEVEILKGEDDCKKMHSILVKLLIM